ncbi:MAG TPA: OmpH family outer membrane protein [Chromatiales bacterium]|nr:OmpH family outer membrane protein [Chromatiales bacterium]
MRKPASFGRIVLVLLAALLLPLTAQAGKIGFVDLQMLLQKSPQRQEASARIEKEFSERKRKIQELMGRIQALETQIKGNADAMSAQQLRAKQRELLNLKREAKREEQYYNEDRNIRNNEELAELQKVIFKAIEKVAVREGYDLVLAEGIAYYSDKVNITDLVLDQLRKDFKQAQ